MEYSNNCNIVLSFDYMWFHYYCVQRVLHVSLSQSFVNTNFKKRNAFRNHCVTTFIVESWTGSRQSAVVVCLRSAAVTSLRSSSSSSHSTLCSTEETHHTHTHTHWTGVSTPEQRSHTPLLLSVLLLRTHTPEPAPNLGMS